MQNVNHEDGDSFERYATGVLPDGAPVHLNRSPVINYPYAKMRPILDRLKKTGDIDKRHGARVRYANPINGGPVLPTMGANLALLPKGFKGEPYRSTDGTIFAVAEGQGTTTIDGKTLRVGRQRRVRGAAVEALFAHVQVETPCCSRFPIVRRRKRSASGAKATNGRLHYLAAAARFDARKRNQSAASKAADAVMPTKLM